MAKARYARFSFKASAILKTGGGVRCYWIQKEPLLSDGAEIVRDANRRIAHALGDDKACCEPARNLRVSDRLNHKYKPAYKVNVSSFDPYRYEIEDFLDLPEAPASLHAPMNKEAVE